MASGFEVTFSPDNDSITNWPPQLTYFFGNKDLEEDKASVEFTIDGVINEIKDIDICIDPTNNGPGNDFEGFRFTLFDNSQIELQTTNPPCASWEKQELNGKRLIGFRVVETDYPDTDGFIVARNIRQIQPIVDCVACDVSMISLQTIENLSLEIGSGSSTPQILIVDLVSQNYLLKDGYSACSGEDYSLAITYDSGDRPLWIVEGGNKGQVITLVSNDFLYTATVTVKVRVELTIEGSLVDTKIFDATLVCGTDCQS